jgi:hypothetical protein
VDAKYTAQLFFDYGNGFSEADSVRLHDCFTQLRNLKIEYVLPEKIKRVRIDPCSYVCCIVVNEISVNGISYDTSKIETNGVPYENGVIVFNTDDPNIIVDAIQGGTLLVDVEVFNIPEVLAGNLSATLEKTSVINKIKGIIKR